VALVLTRTLWGSGQLRNHAVVGLVLALALANVGMHAEVLGLASGVAGRALRFAVDLVVVLLLVIAGRITPAFTRNAFLRDGIARTVRSRAWLDAIVLAAAGALAVSTVLTGRNVVSGGLAIAAGTGAGIRLLGWQPWETRGDPLLWSLHAASAWVAVGLLLTGAGDVGLPVPARAPLAASWRKRLPPRWTANGLASAVIDAIGNRRLMPKVRRGSRGSKRANQSWP
jgi:uncharacterized protein involved in response to NO